MKIAVYGASGMIGSRILREALTRGHDVTAIVRHASRLDGTEPGVTVVTDDVLDPHGVAETALHHDAVVSAIGAGRGEAPDTVVAAARSLIEGLKEAGKGHLLVVGGAGSQLVASGVQLMDTPEFPAEWKQYALAHKKALDLYRSEAQGIDWTYLSPAALIEPGERTGKYRTGGEQLLVDENGDSKISAEDYAVAILDEIEHPKHTGQRFSVAY
jgi:uncharacterized protein